MSIIADTLKRLETDSSETTSGKAEEASGGQDNHGKEAARHLHSSETILGKIAIAITLGLAGLTLLILWEGDHLQIGLSTNGHSSPTSPWPQIVEGIHNEQPNRLAASEPAHVQTPLPSTLVSQTATISSVPTTDQSPIIPPLSKGASSSEPPTLPNESQDLTQAPKPFRKDKRGQRGLNPVNPRATTGSLTSTKQGTHKEYQDVTTQKISPQKFKKPKTTHPVALSLKDKTTLVEKRGQPSQSRTDSTKATASLSTPQPQPDSTGSVIPTADSIQSTSANQLHQGQHFIRIGKYDQAIVLLSPLFHDPPINWQPWFWMGTALLGKGDIEKADQYFLSGLARNDQVPELWVQRALVAQQRGDYQLAIHELRQAESLKGSLPHIPLNLGYAYEKLGNQQLANQYYGKFLKLSEGKEAFFSIRRKLYSRFTQQTSTNVNSPTSSLAKH